MLIIHKNDGSWLAEYRTQSASGPVAPSLLPKCLPTKPWIAATFNSREDAIAFVKNGAGCNDDDIDFYREIPEKLWISVTK